jgi:hypothetical protein
VSFRFISEVHHEAYLPHPQHVALGDFLKARDAEVLLFTYAEQL